MTETPALPAAWDVDLDGCRLLLDHMPRHPREDLLRLAACVHETLRAMRCHMAAEGLPPDRADAVALEGLALALRDDEAALTAAVGPRPDALLAEVVGLTRAARPGPLPASRVSHLVAGWSEADWLRYHAWLWYQNLFRADLACQVGRGRPRAEALADVREAARLGVLPRGQFAAEIGRVLAA
jgi:hypothetical protein